MEIVSMVLAAKVNKHLVSLINQEGVKAIGLCGSDGELITACPAPNVAKLGFVGEVARVDPAILQSIMDDGHIPVIASEW
ncbi:putative acetylglutamate kinase [Rosa chinensis]|uniref:Putative acetylglutamate kinase n=1 Tax=Rosa chinensis TaxID=74649 RepID=A0A2P6Q7M4_ROSCH|nr:putative acetylglutamate kinase [Rosa chinensis]